MGLDKEVPVVSFHLEESCAPKFNRALGEALERFGFVSVIDHGISHERLARAYAAMERLFALSLDAKRRYEDAAEHQTGYAPFGIEHAKDDPRPDIKEFWHVRPPSFTAADRFPAEIPEFKDVFVPLYYSLLSVAIRLLDAIDPYLYRAPGHFRSMVRDGNTVMRLLHYPALDGQIDGMRSAPHEDINFITLLVAATKPGLEIKTRDGDWIPVNNPPDAIIVNAGDMLQAHTGGRIPSTTHRVENIVGNGPRYSIPFFVHPRSEVRLTPMLTAGAYLNQRLVEIGAKKKY